MARSEEMVEMKEKKKHVIPFSKATPRAAARVEKLSRIASSLRGMNGRKARG